MSNKIWGGRFNESPSKIIEQFNQSISFDYRLALIDIIGSKAHVEMLAKTKIIKEEEKNQIIVGLTQIEAEIIENKFIFNQEDEDIHMAIEKRLFAIIGNVAGKMHTARSRNDQVANDMRMYLKEEILIIMQKIEQLNDAIYLNAKNNLGIIMPGYTHLQRAQPVLWSHHMLAYFEMFKRDLERLNFTFGQLDTLVLGAGALAGIGYPIDQEFVAQKLGFSKICNNSIDAVSNRDFIVELSSNIALIAMHLSRFAEEIILWSSAEFNFITLCDSCATGSSIMPQKKNPDVAELTRAKTGRIYGNLINILVVLKGLPLAYNKDLQEDKEAVFDSIDQIKITLDAFTYNIETMTLNVDAINKSLENGYLNATEIADYLVSKSLPFRLAHEITGKIVKYAINEKLKLENIDFKIYQQFSNLFDEDIYEYIKYENTVNRRNSIGGTSIKQVEEQLEKIKKTEE